MVYSALREVWSWHSKSSICKNTWKTGLKFCKLAFLFMAKVPTYLQILKYKRNNKLLKNIEFGDGLSDSYGE